jgi:crotonobetainyl-CoA:carnitine CoA-transferase CaiB-like acyl-CoA transferase
MSTDVQTKITGGKMAAFDELMQLRGDGPPGRDEVQITGADPFYRTPFKVGETVAAVLAGIGVASNDIWQLRTGRRQSVAIDVAMAAATIRTGDYTRTPDGAGVFHHVPTPATFAHMLTVTQPWRTKDGRYVLPHLNLPHLSARVLGVLGCESTPEAVGTAVAQWNSDDLEEAIAAARACGGKVRTQAEWLAHPQGRFLANCPLIGIERTSPGEPEPFQPGDRPLSGVRVLDLTRILAGPLAGRALAEQGADVLMVTAEHLPQTAEHVRDTSHGKRSCFINLKTREGKAALEALVRESDVFLSGYRPGELAKLGFGLADLQRLRPGIVVTTVSCFGPGGPLASRAGWEQVAQCVTGVAEAHGRLAGNGAPKLVFAPVCDYTTGYLAAYGTVLALARRAREGGSFDVQASLCQAGMFLQRQGMVDDLADIPNAPERLTEEALATAVVEADTCYGRLRTLGPVLHMSDTPPRWDRPTPKLGSSEPAWLPR